MKILKLIPLAFLALTACYDPALDIDVPDSPDQYTFYGSSAVELYFWEINEDHPKLPQQISVKFEEESPLTHNLKVAKMPANYHELMGSLESHTEFYGCDGETPQVLPPKIDADAVVLCGDVKIPANFQMQTNLLLMNSARIITKKQPDQPEGIVMFMVKEIELSGQNSLRAVKAQINENMSRAPSMFIYANKVSGLGKLEIFSEKYISVYKVK